MNKPDIRESDIQKYLVQKVKAAGGIARKVKWVGHIGPPDYLVMLPPPNDMLNGLTFNPPIWIELKAPGQKPKPHQVREHNRMRKMGQRVEVVDSFAGVDRIVP